MRLVTPCGLNLRASLLSAVPVSSHGVGATPRPVMTCAAGAAARTAPGGISLDRRRPLPTTTWGADATAASMNSG